MLGKARLETATIIDAMSDGSLTVRDEKDRMVGGFVSRSAGGWTIVGNEPLNATSKNDLDVRNSHALLLGRSGETHARFALEHDGTMIHWNASTMATTAAGAVASSTSVHVHPPRTAKTTWPALELAAAGKGATHSEQLTVAGAVLGDICTCTHSGLGRAIVQISCHVSAADSVLVVLRNAASVVTSVSGAPVRVLLTRVTDDYEGGAMKNDDGTVQIHSISRKRVPLDGGDKSRLVTVVGTGFISPAVCNVTAGSKLEGFVVGFLPPRQTLAHVINCTHLTCVMPRVDTGGPAFVLVSVDQGASFTGQTPSARVDYFPLVAFSVGRRPYTTEGYGNLLVTLDRSVLSATVTAMLANPAVTLQQAVNLVDRSSVLPFSLADLPVDIDTVVTLAVELSTEDGPLLLNKTRRLTRTLQGTRPHAVVIDHHTRSVMVDKTPSQGVGWYIFSGFNCKGVSGSPPFDWAAGDGVGNFTDILSQLTRRGFTQFMIYDLDKIVCGLNASATLVPMMDLFASVGAKVLLDLRAPFAEVIQADTPGQTANSSEKWARLSDIVTAVRDHDATLGYYTCDDCECYTSSFVCRALPSFYDSRERTTIRLQVADQHRRARDRVFEGAGQRLPQYEIP